MSPAGGPILLVEADRSLGERLAAQLAADGFRVELARTAPHARMLASETDPALAILGAMDPPRGALALLEEIRGGSDSGAGWDRSLPALLLGSKADELDVLRAFEAGADDFLCGPPRYLELRARVRAVLRRAAPPPEPAGRIEVRRLRIDVGARSATLCGRPLQLRRMEYELLLHLAREPRRVFERQELLRAVWDYRSAGSTRTIDSHACRLRGALAAVDGRHWVIGIRGVGYRLI